MTRPITCAKLFYHGVPLLRSRMVSSRTGSWWFWVDQHGRGRFLRADDLPCRGFTTGTVTGHLLPWSDQDASELDPDRVVAVFDRRL